MASEATFDVFLSHATPDKPVVEELARRLRRRRLKPFLDKWHLVPGDPWQEALEDALRQSRTFVVFLGPSGIRPWQNEEMRTALEIRARNKNRRVIPVLLPGALIPQEEDLPLFLARLTWVDFRGGLDDPEALRRLVRGIRGIPPGDGPAHASPPPTRPVMIGVPHRNPFFTGREDLLTQLHQQLQTQGISALAQAAVYGLGGIGKTQIAIEYAHRFGEYYRFVLWAVAEDETILRAAYLSIARELGLVEPQTALDMAIIGVKAWLSREAGWLLICDNADDPALLRPYLPPTRTGGKVLLTSRAKSFVSVGIREPLRVEVMDPEDARSFLIGRLVNSDTLGAIELAAELGFLPLALEQAAAYIESVGGSFAEYLFRYQRHGVKLLSRGRLSTDYAKTVATAWQLSFDTIRETSPVSADLLTAAAFLLPDSIPIEIFTQGGSEFGGLLGQELKDATEDSLIFWEALEPLERFSLVERLRIEAFKLHRLTQEVITHSLSEEDQRSWADRVLKALNAAYPLPEFENWKLCEKLQPNVRFGFSLVRKYKLESTEIGRLFNVAAYFAWERGDHTGAKLFDELSLEVRERVLGAEHADTVCSRSNLAETLGALGDYAGARKLQERNLRIQSQLVWGKSPSLLTLGHSLNLAANFGNFTRSWGRAVYSKSIDKFVFPNSMALDLLTLVRHLKDGTKQETALGVQRRVLETAPACALSAKDNEALTHAAFEDLASFRHLQAQTLAIQERELGVEHYNTLISRNNFAVVLYRLGDFTSARKLHERNLEIRERVLGAEHPSTTISAWNLLRTIRELNDPVAETHLIDKLRWLIDLEEGSIPSADQRVVRRLLVKLLHPS